MLWAPFGKTLLVAAASCPLCVPGGLASAAGCPHPPQFLLWPVEGLHRVEDLSKVPTDQNTIVFSKLPRLPAPTAPSPSNLAAEILTGHSGRPAEDHLASRRGPHRGALTWMRSGTPVLSMRLATFTVLPQMSYCGLRAPITPATTGPILSPAGDRSESAHQGSD